MWCFEIEFVNMGATKVILARLRDLTPGLAHTISTRTILGATGSSNKTHLGSRPQKQTNKQYLKSGVNFTVETIVLEGTPGTAD